MEENKNKDGSTGDKKNNNQETEKTSTKPLIKPNPRLKSFIGKSVKKKR